MIPQRLMQIVSLLFFLAGIALAVPVEPCDDEQEQLTADKTVYVAWARSPKPLANGKQGPRGTEQPLRQNGTWQDVGVWDIRKDILSTDPFLFTLEPGRDSSSYSIVQVDTGKKLAYSEGDLNLPVNYAVLAAFILTDKGNTDNQVVDAWTLETDEFGRKALGVGPVDNSKKVWFGGGKAWTIGGCAWNGEDEQGRFCDGFYFMNCAGCYGTPAIIEVTKWEG